MEKLKPGEGYYSQSETKYLTPTVEFSAEKVTLYICPKIITVTEVKVGEKTQLDVKIEF